MPSYEEQLRAVQQVIEEQRIIEEQDRLWQEALANTREAERQRRRVLDWNMRLRGNTIVHDLSNVTPGSSFHISPGTYEVDEITVESFFSLPPKPPKPCRRVISPIFLGPAWVDQ